ncbi:MAG: single-strand selective monofunctional uracil DNA glycosylase [Planctomycetota bacterium]|jgi:single-strand selective monofunctional uracil DNA glycosylase
MEPKRITRDLARAVDALSFGPPVTHVYNPLQYARASFELYLERFARKRPEALLLGMNPGPFGMAQTGVPFGEVSIARDWLKLEAPVGKPPIEHPKRPVDGYACTRSEVSGRRLWGWAQERFATPAKFAKTFFVWNYCPLLFLEDSGRNRTPDKLPAAEKAPLFEACDKALQRIVDELQPKRILGVGKFATDRAKRTLGEGYEYGTVLHPSPASPMANRGWAPQAEKQLLDLGIPLGK